MREILYRTILNSPYDNDFADKKTSDLQFHDLYTYFRLVSQSMKASELG